MLKTRIISGLILAPLLIFSIIFFSFKYFMILVGLISILALWEWTQFVVKESRIYPMILFIILLFCLMYLFPTNPNDLQHKLVFDYVILVIGMIWWVLASLMVILFPRNSEFWVESKSFKELFGILSVVPFFWSTLILRSFEYNISDKGIKLVFLVLFITWSADTGAYFVGKKYGKHKMSPHVSPNKTIEGMAGGVLFAFVIATIYSNIFSISINYFYLIIALTVIFSIFGDLVESMLKRVSHVKDSGRIIPGHGGVLDRIDSLLAAFPIFTISYLLLN